MLRSPRCCDADHTVKPLNSGFGKGREGMTLSQKTDSCAGEFTPSVGRGLRDAHGIWPWGLVPDPLTRPMCRVFYWIGGQ